MPGFGRKLPGAISIAAIGLLLGSCGQRAQIVGEVQDNFGQALAGVVVTIPSTALKARTNGSGRYSIPYVAGKFKVDFAKTGYVGAEVAQDVSVETKVPLETVVLYKTPSSAGIWFFGSTDYVPLNRDKLVTSGGDRRKFAWVYNMTYRISGEFTQLPAAHLYRFLDSDPATIILLKVADDGVIATRSESFNGLGQTHANVINDKYKQVAKGIGVREVALRPGKYAYVSTYNMNLGLGAQRFGDVIFAFEVPASGSSAQ